MQCGINMSYANRQVILHRIWEVFSATFGRSAEDLGMHMTYDVAHNAAKLERHTVAGEERMLLVHRKGATRAFGANRQYQRLEHRPRLGGHAPPAVANSYHDEYRVEVWPGALASGIRFALDLGRRAVSGRRPLAVSRLQP
jgi:tRNA-splicing ligase RtcB